MIDAKKFACMISFISAYYGRAMDQIDVDSVYNSIEGMYVNKQVSVTAMFDALLNDKFIEAIKEHRALTGMGLKESKDEIERLRNRLRPLDKPSE